MPLARQHQNHGEFTPKNGLSGPKKSCYASREDVRQTTHSAYCAPWKNKK